MTLLAVRGSLELGIIYAIMALGVFLSFRTLNIPDLTVDGSFVLGAAFSAVMCTNGHPLAGIALAFVAGCMAGCVTALLHTCLKIQALLAGILVMLALYSVNLRVMESRANIPLVNKITIFDLFPGIPGDDAKTIIPAALLLIIVIFLFFFLNTRFGFVLRATGDNEHMVRAMGVDTNFTILVGMALSNGLVALSGSFIAQYQSYADISMGVGMVIIGLASVIIGEVIFGTKPLLRRLVAVTLGAISYRFIIAFAFELGMPATDLKFISAFIVALALSMPVVKQRAYKLRNRRIAMRDNQGGNL